VNVNNTVNIQSQVNGQSGFPHSVVFLTAKFCWFVAKRD